MSPRQMKAKFDEEMRCSPSKTQQMQRVVHVTFGLKAMPHQRMADGEIEKQFHQHRT